MLTCRGLHKHRFPDRRRGWSGAWLNGKDIEHERRREKTRWRTGGSGRAPWLLFKPRSKCHRRLSELWCCKATLSTCNQNSYATIKLLKLNNKYRNIKKIEHNWKPIWVSDYSVLHDTKLNIANKHNSKPIQLSESSPCDTMQRVELTWLPSIYSHPLP